MLSSQGSQKTIFSSTRTSPPPKRICFQSGNCQVGTLGFSSILGVFEELVQRKCMCSFLASQAAWYRMENGPKSKNGKKIGQKIENGPRPEMGKKWPKNGEKIENDPKSHFLAILGPFFPHFGPRAIFFFWPIFSHFWISARFHSIPGGLTRKSFLCSAPKDA